MAALGNYHLGNYDDAIWCSEEALRRGHSYVALRTLAATLGQLNRTDEARAVLAEMECIKPTNMKDHWYLTCPYAYPSHEAQFLDGLQKAGWKGPI